MISIAQIGTYLPENRKSNLDLLDKFEVDRDFIENKIGVLNRAYKESDQSASDLCLKAFEDLKARTSIDLDQIDCCVVVTQNPDYKIPHVSAIVHGKLGLTRDCACFDISLGCSGYVYALSVVSAFMREHKLNNGLLFTADPYSDIIDENDKNTVLIFGDGATVTLLQPDTKGLQPVGYQFGSDGSQFQSLVCDEHLNMNGRAVFNFTASTIPGSINKLLSKLDMTTEQVERWYFHQGSKYIVDTLTKRLALNKEKVVFGMMEYGNTISSSIPMLLKNDLGSIEPGTKICLSGFGVGLSWASAIFEMK